MSMFENLAENIQRQIFSFLSYANLAELRLVNRWFNEKCSQILNETFVKVKADLENEMSVLHNEIKLNYDDTKDIETIDQLSHLQLRHKILQILNCEISCLHAVCLRHVKRKLYAFAGGLILDHFYEIANRNFSLSDAKNPLESHVTMRLFLLNEEFMDHFEEFIEPAILNKSFCPWFGVKITDIVDLYANSNYHITADYKDEKLQITGRYEILNPENATGLDFPESCDNFRKLLKLSKYIRNEMRWHNFFYYVDSHNDLLKQKQKYNKFCLNSSDSSDTEICVHNETGDGNFRKTFDRRLGNPRTAENICYSIELQCNKNFVPARFENCIESLKRERDVESDKRSAETSSGTNDEISSSYDLILTAKIVIAAEDESVAMENYVELLHNNEMLKFAETIKEIPIF